MYVYFSIPYHDFARLFILLIDDFCDGVDDWFRIWMSEMKDEREREAALVRVDGSHKTNHIQYTVAGTSTLRHGRCRRDFFVPRHVLGSFHRGYLPHGFWSQLLGTGGVEMEPTRK